MPERSAGLGDIGCQQGRLRHDTMVISASAGAQTFMLSLGAPVLGLKGLREGEVRGRLAAESRQVAAAGTALETVGPAAGTVGGR
ncbi:hypothetical protein ACFWA5_04695 [Streptomyces mirabilis]|uniref:hypothetical protein n=1 Tax=Streptomyces mirabilis TaxID=68239 RepID=UPI0036465B5F